MSEATGTAGEVEYADDVCSLSLARRMAALLDRDPGELRPGDPLPRGWHVMLFNPATRQSGLREDGAAHLGFTMPDLGLPRLMLGGRKIAFDGDIPIGEAIRRESRLRSISEKTGRSGRFTLVEVEHRLKLADGGAPVVVETSSYVMLPKDNGTQATANPGSAVEPQLPEGALVRTVVPDVTMLFRYSAITDNPHRIHYDLRYATEVEGYPALVVNGSLPQMILLDMFREYAGREPSRYLCRNRAPIFCERPLTLSVVEAGESFALRAHTAEGVLAIEAEIW